MNHRRDTQGRGDIRIRELGLMALSPLWVAGVLFAYHTVSFYVSHGTFGIDAHAYWLTHRHAQWYGLAPGTPDAYLYTPAFAQAAWPITALPFRLFQILWATIEIAAYSWLLAPLGWRLAGPVLLLCSVEFGLGNIYPILAVCAVVGLQRAWVWAFPALTKMTPALGFVWFAVRGEWRKLAIASGTTAALAGISYAISPSHWSAWWGYATSHAGGGELAFPVRLVVGIILVAIGARTNRSWLVAVSMLIVCPVFQDVSPLTMLTALPRLLDRDRRTSSSDRRARPTRSHPPITPGVGGAPRLVHLGETDQFSSAAEKRSSPTRYRRMQRATS